MTFTIAAATAFLFQSEVRRQSGTGPSAIYLVDAQPREQVRARSFGASPALAVRLSELFPGATEHTSRALKGHPLGEQTVSLVRELLAHLEGVHAGQPTPAFMARAIPDDDSISVEMRAERWRMLLSVERDATESGWSIVFAPSLGISPLFGSVSQIGLAAKVLRAALTGTSEALIEEVQLVITPQARLETPQALQELQQAFPATPQEFPSLTRTGPSILRSEETTELSLGKLLPASSRLTLTTDQSQGTFIVA